MAVNIVNPDYDEQVAAIDVEDPDYAMLVNQVPLTIPNPL